MFGRYGSGLARSCLQDPRAKQAKRRSPPVRSYSVGRAPFAVDIVASLDGGIDSTARNIAFIPVSAVLSLAYRPPTVEAVEAFPRHTLPTSHRDKGRLRFIAALYIEASALSSGSFEEQVGNSFEEYRVPCRPKFSTAFKGAIQKPVPRRRRQVPRGRDRSGGRPVCWRTLVVIPGRRSRPVGRDCILSRSG